MSRRARSLSLALALCLALPSVARAVPTQQLVARSREAAARNAWNDSARALEELVAAGFTGDGVLYDLGVAYARAGRFGEAIWRFEQTTRRGVLALDAQHNLRVTRLALAHRDAARTGRAVVETAQPAVVQAGELLPPHVAAALSLAAQLGALACALALRARVRKGAERAGGEGKAADGSGEVSRVGFAIGAVAFASAAVFTGALVAARGLSPPAGIVLRDGARLLHAPAADAIAASPVREGERVDLLGKSGTFVRVRSRDEAGVARDGWLPESAVGALD